MKVKYVMISLLIGASLALIGCEEDGGRHPLVSGTNKRHPLPSMPNLKRREG